MKAKKEDDSKHMRTIALPNGETITVDMRHVDVTNPSDEQVTWKYLHKKLMVIISWYEFHSCLKWLVELLK